MDEIYYVHFKEINRNAELDISFSLDANVIEEADSLKLLSIVIINRLTLKIMLITYVNKCLCDFNTKKS